MSNNAPKSQPDKGDRYSLRALETRASLARLGAIGAVVLAIIACFAWAAGWFSPSRLDQTRITNEFQAVFGLHPGFRRNHAKGVCLTGAFDSNGAGMRLSEATIFKPGHVPVFGRFSLPGGNPFMPDGPKAVRAMALNFTLADGEVWRTAMIDIPVFAVRDAQGFYDQLVATKLDPQTGKPDPANVEAFLKAHPETVRAMAIIKAHPFSSGFANATYGSLNAFRFVNAAGDSTPVRWWLVPVDSFAPEPANPPEDKNYLFDTLIARIRSGPAQWHLILALGQPGDPTNDATIPWPDSREHIDTGILTVTGIEPEASGNCRDINFDPLVLPSGIAPSDDPLLSPRSAVYSVSFTRRTREPKTPSAVQTGTGR